MPIKIKKTIYSLLIISAMCFLGYLATIYSIKYVDEKSMNNWLKTGEDKELIIVSSQFKFADKYKIVTFESTNETVRARSSSMARKKMETFKFDKPFCMEINYSIYLKEHSSETKKSDYLLKDFKPIELKNCTQGKSQILGAGHANQ